MNATPNRAIRRVIRRNFTVLAATLVFIAMLLAPVIQPAKTLASAEAATTATSLSAGSSVSTPNITAPITSSSVVSDWGTPRTSGSSAALNSGSWWSPTLTGTGQYAYLPYGSTINMGSPFSFKVGVKNVAGYSQGVYFVPATTTSAQLDKAMLAGNPANSGLGIGQASSGGNTGGVAGAVFAGSDLWYDSTMGDSTVGCNFGSGIGCSLAQVNLSYQIRIATTNTSGVLNASSSNASVSVSGATANTAQTPATSAFAMPTGGENIAVSWVPTTPVTTSSTTVTGTLTLTVSDPANSSSTATVTYTGLVMQTSMNMGISAINGNLTGNQPTFNIPASTISGNLNAPVTVNYVNSAGATVAKSSTINANVGSSIGIVPNGATPNDPTKYDYALPSIPGYTVTNIQGTNGTLTNPCTNGSSGTCGTTSNTATTTTFASVAPVSNSTTANVVTVTYAANPQTVYYAYATGYSAGTNGLPYPAAPSPQTGTTGTPITALTGSALPSAPAGYYWSAVRYNSKYYSFAQANQINPTATWSSLSSFDGSSGTTIYDAMALAVTKAGGGTGTMDGNTINSTTGNSNAGSCQPLNGASAGTYNCVNGAPSSVTSGGSGKTAAQAADNSFLIMVTQIPLVTGTVTFTVPSGMTNPGPVTLNQGTNSAVLNQKGYLGGPVSYASTNTAMAKIPNGYNVSIKAPNGTTYTSTKGTTADIQAVMAAAETANATYTNASNVAVSGSQDSASYPSTFNYSIAVTPATQTANFTYNWASKVPGINNNLGTSIAGYGIPNQGLTYASSQTANGTTGSSIALQTPDHALPMFVKSGSTSVAFNKWTQVYGNSLTTAAPFPNLNSSVDDTAYTTVISAPDAYSYATNDDGTVYKTRSDGSQSTWISTGQKISSTTTLLSVVQGIAPNATFQATGNNFVATVYANKTQVHWQLVDSSDPVTNSNVFGSYQGNNAPAFGYSGGYAYAGSVLNQTGQDVAAAAGSGTFDQYVTTAGAGTNGYFAKGYIYTDDQLFGAGGATTPPNGATPVYVDGNGNYTAISSSNTKFYGYEFASLTDLYKAYGTVNNSNPVISVDLIFTAITPTGAILHPTGANMGGALVFLGALTLLGGTFLAYRRRHIV